MGELAVGDKMTLQEAAEEVAGLWAAGRQRVAALKCIDDSALAATAAGLLTNMGYDWRALGLVMASTPVRSRSERQPLEADEPRYKAAARQRQSEARQAASNR